MMKNEEVRLPVSRGILGVLVILLLAMMMKNSQYAVEYINRGLSLCAHVMIPSLFPFMVASELLVRSGGGETIARLIGKWQGPLLGFGESGIVVYLLGIFCGFPVGARVAADYDAEGKLTRRDLNRLLCSGNIPSSAFLVSAVGTSLFGSRRVGWCLLFLTFVSAFLVGLLYRLILPGRGIWLDTAPVGIDRSTDTKQGGGFGLISESIGKAADGMLRVSATVVLFSALTGAWTAFSEALNLPAVVRAASFGFFEMSMGVCEAATLPGRKTALILAAAILGWGGLSVHCQLLSFCRGDRVALGWFWLSRLLQAVLCALGMWGLIAVGYVQGSVTPQPIGAERITLQTAAGALPAIGTVASWIVFFVAVLIRVAQMFRRSKEARVS